MSITITDEMVEAGAKVISATAGCLPFCEERAGCVCREETVAALTAAAPLIEAAVRERCAQVDADAARYRWLRAGNAYAPEEECVDGGDELDQLCDEGIAASIRADGGAE
jgi:hypothetical protein